MLDLSDNVTKYVYNCQKCKRYYVDGGVCPCCKDENGNSVPLRIEPVSNKEYEKMLFKGELFSK